MGGVYVTHVADVDKGQWRDNTSMVLQYPTVFAVAIMNDVRVACQVNMNSGTSNRNPCVSVEVRACYCVHSWWEACISIGKKWKFHWGIFFSKGNVTNIKCISRNWNAHGFCRHTAREREKHVSLIYGAATIPHISTVTHSATWLREETKAASVWLGLSLFHLTTALPNI